MAMLTYTNKINEVEIGLGIERLLVADYPNVWTPVRIDLEDLDTTAPGFWDLGAVVEDTPSFNVSREMYELATGLPQVIQFQQNIVLGASFSISLYSHSWRKAQFAFGTFKPQVTITTVMDGETTPAAVDVATVTSDGFGFTVTFAPATPLVAGQLIVLGAPADFEDPDAVEAIIDTVSTDGITYTLKTKPYMPIVVGDNIGTYELATQPIGGAEVRYYSLLGVTDFTGGWQMVHELQKASPAGEWTEEIRPDDAGKIPLEFNALGYEKLIGGCTEILVAQRHEFAPQAVICA